MKLPIASRVVMARTTGPMVHYFHYVCKYITTVVYPLLVLSLRLQVLSEHQYTSCIGFLIRTLCVSNSEALTRSNRRRGRLARRGRRSVNLDTRNPLLHGLVITRCRWQEYVASAQKTSRAEEKAILVLVPHTIKPDQSDLDHQQGEAHMSRPW